VAVVGPKALDWYDPRVLVEVGVTTDRAGHRETGLERRERDQGQHDAVRDVLAVGTAGALVRREVWDEVGGLDPQLPLFRDELDLGWRVTSTGRRVAVVPAAVVRHARAATTGRRSAGALGGRPTAVDRRHALLVLLAHASPLRLLVAVPALLAMQVLRVLGHLLLRQVAAARDEALAPLAVLGRLGRLRAMRRERRRLRSVPPGAVRPLLASRGGRLRSRAEAAAGWLAGRSAPPPRALDSLSDPVGVDDEHPGGDGPHLLRGLVTRPGVLLLLSLALLALVAERAVLSVGGGLLQGGRLLPAPGGASDLWASYAATWASTGSGTPAPAPPRTAVLAALSTVLLGKPWLAVDLLLLASVPLAGLTAYLAVRPHVASRLLRGWAAATWALLPVGTGAVAGGRLDAAVVQVALPLLALAGVSVLRRDPRGGWHRVWALALGLSLVVAFAPSLWLVAAPLLVAGAAAVVLLSPPARVGAARRRALAAGVVLAVPPLLLLPWSLELVRTPGLLLHGPGRVAPDPALVDAALPAWHLLALSPAVRGSRRSGWGWPFCSRRWPPWSGPDRARAVVVAVDDRGRAGCWWRWSGSHERPARHGRPRGRRLARRPAAGGAAGLLAAALLGADGLRARLARVDFGSRQVLAAGLAVLAVLLPLVAAGSWLTAAPTTRCAGRRRPAVPAFAAAELDAAPGLRVLLLEPTADGAVAYELVTGAGVRLGAADLAPRAGRREAVDDVVADLVSARGSDAAAALSTRAVRYVALPTSAAGGPVAAALDAQAGLTRRADDPVLLWEVLAPAARLVVLAPETAERARSGARAPTADADVEPLPVGRSVRVPAGDDGRLLVLAEAADPGWQAELDGERLEPATAWGGVQAFALPETAAPWRSPATARAGAPCWSCRRPRWRCCSCWPPPAPPGAAGSSRPTTTPRPSAGSTRPRRRRRTARAARTSGGPGASPGRPRREAAAAAARRRRRAARARHRRRAGPDRGAGAASRPEQVPVVGAAVVCPDVRQPPAGGTTRVAAGLAAAGDGDSATSTATVGTRVVGSDRGAELPLTAAGQAVAELGGSVDDGALAVTAEGAPAAGLAVVQTADLRTGDERGLATATCLPARTDAWLLGGGATVGESSVLVLVNPDPVEAAVDVTVLSAEGAVDARPGRGLRVPAEGRLLVPLEELAPDRSATAVRVQATRGRVASALRHSRVSGATAGGLDYAASADGPQDELVVPALPAGPGGRAVLVANPGETDVAVQLELTAADGQFVPGGLSEVPVPAQSTVTVALTGELAATPAAVRVTSTGGPVLAAGLLSQSGADDVRDFGYVAAVPGLTTPALVPDVPVDGATTSVLLLSAVGGDAVVDVEAGPVVGGQDVSGTRRVEVPGGRTVVVPLGELLPPTFLGRTAVLVRPDPLSAPVHAAVVRTASLPDGPLVTAQSLRGALPEVERPRVVRDPGVGAG
jgi:hypothetical protein